MRKEFQKLRWENLEKRRKSSAMLKLPDNHWQRRFYCYSLEFCPDFI